MPHWERLSHPPEFLAELLEAVRDSVIATDLEGRITYWNQGAGKIFGYTADEMLGRTTELLYPDESPERIAADWTGILEGRDSSGQWVGRRKDGSTVELQVTTTAVRDASGEPAGFIGISQDITERRRADQALRESEGRYRAFLEQTAEGVWRIELERPLAVTLPEGTQIEWFYDHSYLAECNDAMARMYGLTSAADLAGARLADLLPRSDPHNLAFLTAFIRSGYRLTDAESHEVDHDGRPRHFLNNFIGIVEDGRLLRAWGSQRDITDRKQAEAALRESEERLKLAQTAAGLAVWDWDLESDLAEYSPEFFALYGLPPDGAPPRYREWLERLVHPDDQARVAADVEDALAGLRPHETEFRIMRLDGAVRWVAGRGRVIRDAGGRPARMMGVSFDVTARRELDERLRQLDRLESIGRLAGGVAHEANNQMSVVLGAASFLLARTDLAQDARQDLEQIRKAAERTAAITQQLLAFSRRQVLQPQVLDLNEEIRGLEPVLRRSAGAGSTLDLRLPADLPPVRADAGQLAQVLLNLVLNARDAMPDGGTLAIETANAELTPSEAGAPGGESIRPGSYVCLTVSDTGHGMDPQTLAHAFEPFFTTKPMGQGTGLGLATVHGIVRQSGGHVLAQSERGRGTTLRVYLPVAEGAPARTAPVPPPAGAVSGRVLVVEDEPAVRRMLTRTLRTEGYRVLEAGDAAEALDHLGKDSEPVNLVVLDVVLPGLNGRELARRIQQLRPDLPILFVSGFTGEEVDRRGLLERGAQLLRKPFAPETLARSVRELLAASHDRASLTPRA